MSLNISFKGKKGQWADYLLVGVLLFALGIVIVFGKLVVHELNMDFQNTTDMNAESKEVFNNFDNNYVGLWDNLFAFLFVGIFITMIISTFFIRSHPIFYIIMMVIIGILTLLSILLSDFFTEIMSTPEFVGYANQFAKIGFMMGTKFPVFMLGFGIILGIIMYAKSGG